MALKRGELRHRIRFEEYAYTLDSNGEVIQDDTGETPKVWTLVRQSWAKIVPASGREFIAAQAIQSKVIARIVVPHQTVNPAWRIVHNGTVYCIEAVLPDADSGLEYLSMPVSTGVNDNGQ